MDQDISLLYRRITKTLIEKGLTITSMESCTGGLIASMITDTEGSSAVLKGAFVTYSNEAKILQGVPAETIENCGIYSKETALAMAAACKETYQASIGIGVTGTFSNADPNNADSIPGLVYYCIRTDKETVSKTISLPLSLTRKEAKLMILADLGNTLLSLM